MNPNLIRNFNIIAHIDHGKSTLADRILVACGAMAERDMHAQVLDSMDLERERGITIKAKAVALDYMRDGVMYRLNLIDTPGHVDFNYEVSRSMRACEGSLLLVDAAQGVQAQTVANAYLAIEAGLEIIPVLNKVDLAAARPDEVKAELETTFGIEPHTVLHVSGKTGLGVPELLDAILKQVPAPTGDHDAPLQALIFDSVYDVYRGVIAFVRVRQGNIRKGDVVRFKGTARTYEVLELGLMRPKMTAQPELSVGETGYLWCNIKNMHDVKVGDTVVHEKDADSVAMLPGYREPKPMVHCGIYPVNNADFAELRKALDKLSLNDASFTYHPESSEALGFGFRCGFLGLLHMEIVQERLERESGLDIVQTAPNVTYQVLTRAGNVVDVERPSDLPDPSEIEEFREPIVRVSLLVPSDSIGNVMKICLDRRGKYLRTEYLSTERALLVYDLPMGEILYDFYDILKSITRGFGSMDYDLIGYQAGALVRVRIMIAAEDVDAFSFIAHKDDAEFKGRKILERLRKKIPRHLFAVALQAAIGGKIIARETIAPMRKDVTSKCYGGDISRKRKLLEKQKEGKKRLKAIGGVEVPQEAFLAVLGEEREEKGKRKG
ncbi:MAG: translation elongation factor 4 [Planctomycetes bacterium]|nr:translation elongation factor 4 [Planctomycetota bacterium]